MQVGQPGELGGTLGAPILVVPGQVGLIPTAGPAGASGERMEQAYRRYCQAAAVAIVLLAPRLAGGPAVPHRRGPSPGRLGSGTWSWLLRFTRGLLLGHAVGDPARRPREPVPSVVERPDA